MIAIELKQPTRLQGPQAAGTRIREYGAFHVRSFRGWNEPSEESQKELAWLRRFHTQLRHSESAH